MVFARTLLARRLHSLLEAHYPLCVCNIFHSSTPLPQKISPFHHRPIASLPQTQGLTDPETKRREIRKPLVDLFKGPAWLPKKAENSENEGKDNHENKKLKKKFGQLEREVRRRKGKSKQGSEAGGLSAKTGHNESRSEDEGGGQSDQGNKDLTRKLKTKSKEEVEVHKGEGPKKAELKRLYALFGNGIGHANESKEEKSQKAPVEMHKKVEQREPLVSKEFSPEMEMFVYYLYREGYFNDANFVKGKKFDLSWFDDSFARGYLMYAVRKFCKDKREISKWLSGSDLKLVAEFGCPSSSRKNVIPAKRLRSFFKIPESNVCDKCTLRDSCQYVNQSVWRSDNNNLDLGVVMQVLCSHASMSEHPKLVVPDEVKNSANRLLKEVVKLSQTI